MIQPENITDFVVVKILVLLHRTVVWSTSIRKRIFVLIPEQSAEPKNGITPTKSGQFLKETSITSRIIFVRTQNENTLHADLILAGIAQLITVVLADKIKHHEYIRSLKPLIA